MRSAEAAFNPLWRHGVERQNVHGPTHLNMAGALRLSRENRQARGLLNPVVARPAALDVLHALVPPSCDISPRPPLPVGVPSSLDVQRR